jgi:hypothetical protein
VTARWTAGRAGNCGERSRARPGSSRLSDLGLWGLCWSLEPSFYTLAVADGSWGGFHAVGFRSVRLSSMTDLPFLFNGCIVFPSVSADFLT